MRRHEKQQEEQRRWSYYETIPQKHWVEMSGRQAKVLREQASRYGLPFGQRVVNLPQLAKAIHDFLATHARLLSRGRDEDELILESAPSPALERYRDEKAKLARLDRLEKEKELIHRDDLDEVMQRMAVVLRNTGELLQRQFGNDASEVLNDALDDLLKAIEELVSGGEQEGDN